MQIKQEQYQQTNKQTNKSASTIEGTLSMAKFPIFLCMRKPYPCMCAINEVLQKKHLKLNGTGEEHTYFQSPMT